jgi:hypothetical protein
LVIDRNELHDWLIAEISEQPVGVPEARRRSVAFGAVDAYLRLGRHFGLFSAEEDGQICALLGNTRR